MTELLTPNTSRNPLDPEQLNYLEEAEVRNLREDHKRFATEQNQSSLAINDALAEAHLQEHNDKYMVTAKAEDKDLHPRKTPDALHDEIRKQAVNN